MTGSLSIDAAFLYEATYCAGCMFSRDESSTASGGSGLSFTARREKTKVRHHFDRCGCNRVHRARLDNNQMKW